MATTIIGTCEVKIIEQSARHFHNYVIKIIKKGYNNEILSCIMVCKTNGDCH